MKKWKKMMTAAAALGALAMLAGCTTASAVTMDEAKEIALNAAGVEEAIFVERDLDPDDGVYEIEFTSGGVEYEFEVDMQTGAIREIDRDREDRGPAETKPAETAPAQNQTSITLEEAKAIAYAHAGVSEADAYDKSYERDDGRYEIDFEYDGYDYEYDISYTGEILKSEKEPDRDNDRPVSAPVETQPVETAPAQPAPTEPARITLEEAKAIAYAHAGVNEADAYDKSYERDDGRYEIDFEYDGYDYEYDISYTGEILKSEKEPDRDDWCPACGQHHDDCPAGESGGHRNQGNSDAGAARISGKEAKAIALSHAGVSEADAYDWDVEWDDGVWEVSFESAGVEYEYKISADGTVRKAHKETDD